MQKENRACEIRPAERLATVGEYYFSQKLREVAGMNAAGKKVINLGVGSPDRPPRREAIDVLCREAKKDGVHGYQPYTGLPALREAYAGWYRTWFGAAPDPQTEILPLIGSKEGILHISLAFLNPGDGVLAPDPGYPTYRSVTALAGARRIDYTLKEANGWQPDFEALEAMDLRGVKLMWTNYPHMPTGARAEEGLFERLVDFG
ncbi:MAG: aminotransferase class I/II-fold pyridoxal phosphate-dependent enzyme, partial [Tannerella sp.]|nr:aminotransferase class I/II-fold pyridoxal phosphate-dependent enzyme [Tannerella sp.]